MEELAIYCKTCDKTFNKNDLQRSCSNCFACASCEIYICPECRYEIVVKEMQKKLKNHPAGTEK